MGSYFLLSVRIVHPNGLLLCSRKRTSEDRPVDRVSPLVLIRVCFLANFRLQCVSRRLIRDM